MLPHFKTGAFLRRENTERHDCYRYSD